MNNNIYLPLQFQQPLPLSPALTIFDTITAPQIGAVELEVAP